MSLQKLLDKTKEEFEKKFGIMEVISYEEVDGIFALKEDAEQVKHFVTNSQLAVIEEVKKIIEGYYDEAPVDELIRRLTIKE